MAAIIRRSSEANQQARDLRARHELAKSRLHQTHGRRRSDRRRRGESDRLRPECEARTAAHCVQWCDTFFNGDTAVDAKSFDGLTKVLTGTGQEFAAGINGAQLTLDMMDQLIDLVLPGKPDALFMSRRTRRKLSSLWTQYTQADPAMDIGPG
jgi:hypothetical protein